jgi:autotransporter-associated beta strand protein
MNVGDEYTLIQYGGATLPSSATNNLVVTSTLPGFAFSVVDPATTPNAIKIHVDQAQGNDFWTGASSSVWDFSAVIWTRSGNPVAFNDGDYATFDDSSTVTNVMLSGDINLSGLTVSSGGEAYNFGGTGSLSGKGGLHLSGIGLTIANTGTNTFAGPITIDYGTLQLGNGGAGGSIGAGVLTNMGLVILDRSDDGLTLSNNITGSGSIASQGTGTVTLTGANTFSGEVDVQHGTLRTLNSSALGDIFSGTTVSNGAALDIGANNVNLSKEPITVSGAGPDGSGAIVNSSASTAFVGANIGQVTLTGDTTIGGSGRLDYRASSATADDVALYCGGQPYTLTKAGTNLLQMAGVQVDPGLGDINIEAGTLGFQWYMPSLGDSSKHLTVFDGASLAFYDMSNSVSKVLILNNGASVLSQHGDNEFDGPVTVTGTNTISVTSGTLTFANAIDGTGDLLKTGGATLILSGATETYTGGTYVNGGTLALMDPVDLASSPAIVLAGGTIDVSGRSDGTLPLGSSTAQWLAGGGNITGNLNENSGSTVNPGNNTGTATLNVSGTAALNGFILLDLNRTNLQTSDEITAASFTTGGILTVTNLGPDLVTNDKFQLFSSAVSGFATVNLPAKNSTGTVTYQWQNDLGKDGSITLLSGGSGVNTTPTNIVFSVSGDNLTISWPADHLGWTLQTQTNSLGAGLGDNWVDVPGSTTTTSLVVPINPDNGSVFFRMKYQP